MYAARCELFGLGAQCYAGLLGRSRALCGHLGHARLANRGIYWLHRSSQPASQITSRSSRVLHELSRLDAEQRGNQPRAGSLFELGTGVRGLAPAFLTG